MAKLIWNRCPKHRIDMTRDYDEESRPFYYCPICGFYRYYEGSEGYNSELILKNQRKIFNFFGGILIHLIYLILQLDLVVQFITILQCLTLKNLSIPLLIK